MLGSFVMGLLAAAATVGLSEKKSMIVVGAKHAWQNLPELHIGLRTGYCGSLTTFASWELDLVQPLIGGQVTPRRGLWHTLPPATCPAVPFDTAEGQRVKGLVVTCPSQRDERSGRAALHHGMLITPCTLHHKALRAPSASRVTNGLKETELLQVPATSHTRGRSTTGLHIVHWPTCQM